MCVLDGQTPIYPPHTPQSANLVPHNPLLAHLFNVLTTCQAMQSFKIVPGKNMTIHALLHKNFPPLKSTDNKPTPYVSPKTIGYIHGLIVDSITLFPTNACNARALRNELMILEVLDEQEPKVFREELFNTLRFYFEEIQGMPGAGGRPEPKHFTRKMRKPGQDAVGDGGSVGIDPQPPAAAAAAADPPAAAAAAGPPAEASADDTSVPAVATAAAAGPAVAAPPPSPPAKPAAQRRGAGGKGARPPA